MPPIVGLTLDTAGPTGIGKVGRYLIRENYCSAIAKAGGIPIVPAARGRRWPRPMPSGSTRWW